MRYLRDWRLYLATEALAATTRPIIAIALEAGYTTEAAFTRAFTRSIGTPPAEWRRTRFAANRTSSA
jgi:AraC-like DNA-binding protein